MSVLADLQDAVTPTAARARAFGPAMAGDAAPRTMRRPAALALVADALDALNQAIHAAAECERAAQRSINEIDDLPVVPALGGTPGAASCPTLR